MNLIKKYSIQSADKIKLIGQIKDLLAKDQAIIFAYLYGSFARENTFNDVDVAVYLDNNVLGAGKLFFQKEMSLATEIELLIKEYEIDLRGLNTAPLSFQFQVISEGEMIYLRNQEDREINVSFEARTRSYYFDFQPHLNYFYQKYVLGK